MPKARLGSPRNLGSVNDVQFASVRIYVDQGRVIAVVEEGEDVAGVFTPSVEKALDREVTDMAAASKSAYTSFLKAMLREYADQEGYTGVTVT